MPGQGVQLQNSGTGRDGGSGLVSLCEVYKQVEHGEVGVARISQPRVRRGCDWIERKLFLDDWVCFTRWNKLQEKDRILQLAECCLEDLEDRWLLSKGRVWTSSEETFLIRMGRICSGAYSELVE